MSEAKPRKTYSPVCEPVKFPNKKQANPKVLDYISQTMVYYPSVYSIQKLVLWVTDITQKLRKTNWTELTRPKLDLTKNTDICKFQPIFVFFWLTAVEQKVSFKINTTKPTRFIWACTKSLMVCSNYSVCHQIDLLHFSMS